MENILLIWEKIVNAVKTSSTTPFGKMLIVVTFGLIATLTGLTLILTAIYTGKSSLTVQTSQYAPTPTPSPKNSILTEGVPENERVILEEVEKNHQLLINGEYQKLYERLSTETKKTFRFEDFNQFMAVYLGDGRVIDVKTISDATFPQTDIAVYNVEITLQKNQAITTKTLQEFYKKEDGIWKLSAPKIY